jgi:hypothetical protein
LDIPIVEGHVQKFQNCKKKKDEVKKLGVMKKEE